MRGDPEDDLSSGLLPALQAFLDFQSFGTLPIGGGLFDQDPQMMADFRLIKDVIAENRPRGGG